MAIRIREVNGKIVALCAAKSEEQKGDVYLNDGQHEALGTKFKSDYIKMGFIK